MLAAVDANPDIYRAKQAYVKRSGIGNIMILIASFITDECTH